jgi:hypothetical protein
MSDVCFQLQEQLSPLLRSGDTAECERTIAEALAALPTSPFHVALDLSISNSSEEAAEHFDRFFRLEANRFEIDAAYTEMNGLRDFDVFAYNRYGGHDDYEWLTNWQSKPYDSMIITGLERLQEVYDNGAFRDKRFQDAGYIAELLAVAKFQDLIRRAASHMKERRFPLLATGHEYEFIFEVRPDGWRESRWSQTASAIPLDPPPAQIPAHPASEGEPPWGSYNEADVLRRYIWRNYKHALNEREHALHAAAILEIKARNSGPKSAARLRAMPGYFLDDEVIAIAEGELSVFEQRCCNRLLCDHGDQVYVNRCERCDRIVASPIACACLWCGHHWYDRRAEMVARAASSIYPKSAERRSKTGDC